MLIATGATYFPGIVAALVGTVIGAENLPGRVYITVHFLFYMNYILNPVIQSYFRRELKDFIVRCCRAMPCKKHIGEEVSNKVHATTTASTDL